MRKHIYIAYTGGTIGMKPSKQGYVPAAGFLSDTLKKMPEFHRSEMPLFTLHEYDNLIDSSDMDPSGLGRAINRGLQSHAGTD